MASFSIPFHLTLNAILGLGIHKPAHPTSTLTSIPFLSFPSFKTWVSADITSIITTTLPRLVVACVGVMVTGYRRWMWGVGRKLGRWLIGSRRGMTLRRNAVRRVRRRRQDMRLNPSVDLIDFDGPVMVPQRGRFSRIPTKDVNKTPITGLKDLIANSKTVAFKKHGSTGVSDGRRCER
ncbi:hypothetical protein BC829DRAFT_75999 [Chytridium lagenaria]|nr:hypothetical protein BC829DRAFT_75999 [Chytridium lagenaria]